MYSKERFETYLDIDEMIKKYYHYDVTYERCSKCSGFAGTWACPGFDFDPKEYFSSFRACILLSIGFPMRTHRR